MSLGLCVREETLAEFQIEEGWRNLGDIRDFFKSKKTFGIKNDITCFILSDKFLLIWSLSLNRIFNINIFKVLPKRKNTFNSIMIVDFL